MDDSTTSQTQHADFSLVGGGLLFRCYRRARLCGDALELVRRRMLITSCVAWLPLLILLVLSGHALGGSIKIPFLHDVEAHVRFLIALPILIAAELIVHLRISATVQRFVERRIVIPEDLPKFREAIASTLRVRNSPLVEGALLVLVYTLGLWVWRSQIAHGGATWYTNPDATHMNLTAAGYWFVLVSIPFFQFILLRWYLRFFLWFRLLWRISGLNLRLIPSHPDRAGGIGFLGRSSYAFGPVLFAQGALLAGLIASQIFHEGQNLMAFKVQIVGFLAFFIVIILSPLTVFAPHLARAKRQGSADFGNLATRYAREFEDKWLHGHAPAGEPLLGNADVQSLADIGNSYSVVQEMRLFPFGWKDVTRLAITAATPLVPLALTIFSVEDLVSQLIAVLF